MELSAAEYEERKLLLEGIKKLVKSEQELLFSILKTEKVDFSENSNGIFFDVAKLTPVAYRACKNFIDFCQLNRDTLQSRDDEQRKVQDIVDSYT